MFNYAATITRRQTICRTCDLHCRPEERFKRGLADRNKSWRLLFHAIVDSQHNCRKQQLAPHQPHCPQGDDHVMFYSSLFLGCLSTTSTERGRRTLFLVRTCSAFWLEEWPAQCLERLLLR